MNVYKYGSTGAGVRDLQISLNKLGSGLVVDGNFGPATRRAVSDFQSDNGLTVDGIAGPATNARITARINEKIGVKMKAAFTALADIPEVKELEKLL